MHPVSTIS